MAFGDKKDVVEGQIQAVGRVVTRLNERMHEAADALSAHRDAVRAVIDRVERLEKLMEAELQTMTGVQDEQRKIARRVANLEGALETARIKVATLETNMERAFDRIVALESDHRIASLERMVARLNERIIKLEGIRLAGQELTMKARAPGMSTLTAERMEAETKPPSQGEVEDAAHRLANDLAPSLPAEGYESPAPDESAILLRMRMRVIGQMLALSAELLHAEEA